MEYFNIAVATLNVVKLMKKISDAQMGFNVIDEPPSVENINEMSAEVEKS